jgi:hypothetical protein
MQIHKALVNKCVIFMYINYHPRFYNKLLILIFTNRIKGAKSSSRSYFLESLKSKMRFKGVYKAILAALTLTLTAPLPMLRSSIVGYVLCA